jgi:hypothetical protein
MAKNFFSGFWPPENHRSTFPSYLPAFAQISLFDMMDKKKKSGRQEGACYEFGSVVLSPENCARGWNWLIRPTHKRTEGFSLVGFCVYYKRRALQGGGSAETAAGLKRNF